MANKPKPQKQPELEDDQLSDKEATKRFERTVRNMVNTPPKPHKPKRKDDDGGRKSGN